MRGRSALCQMAPRLVMFGRGREVLRIGGVMFSRGYVAAVGVMLIVAAGAWTTPQSSNTGKEEFRALAVNMAAMTPASATPVEITIERWTSDETRDRLMTILKEQG